MNTLKKTVLGIGLLTIGIANAQDSSLRHMLKVGGNVGVALPSENTSMAVGADVAYQYLPNPGFGIGIATGYTHYFGKENDVNAGTIDNNDVGFVPIAALFRYYPKKTGIFIGADLGYGVLVGDDHVASNYAVNRPTGGLYIKPEIGYHDRNWNFAVQYQKVFTDDKADFAGQKYNVGALGLGVSYNIPLGSGQKTDK